MTSPNREPSQGSGELLDAAKEALSVLLDYIPQIEARGASLHYGRGVVGRLVAAIAREESRR